MLDAVRHLAAFNSRAAGSRRAAEAASYGVATLRLALRAILYRRENDQVS